MEINKNLKFIARNFSFFAARLTENTAYIDKNTPLEVCKSEHKSVILRDYLAVVQ